MGWRLAGRNFSRSNSKPWNCCSSADNGTIFPSRNWRPVAGNQSGPTVHPRPGVGAKTVSAHCRSSLCRGSFRDSSKDSGRWSIFLLLWAMAVVPAAYLFGWKNWRWVAVSGGAAFVVFIVIGSWLVPQSSIASRPMRIWPCAARCWRRALNQPAVLETAKNPMPAVLRRH